MRENCFQNLKQDKNEKDSRQSEGKYIHYYNVRINTISFLALTNISEVFNQLKTLENEMKGSLISQDRAIAAKTGSGQIVPECSPSPLPDYLLLSTVLTEDYPVPAIATSIRQEEQGWNILVRRGEKQHPVR